MWEPSSKKVDAARFGPFEPEEVLYECDGPRIFTFRDTDDELNLAYWSGDDLLTRPADDRSERPRDRFVVVPTDNRILAALKRGEISVLQALAQPRSWLCDVFFDGELASCWSVDFSQIPGDHLPIEGTMLWARLEPILTLRAQGPDIVPGRTPGSVIRSCVEGPQRALKILGEYVLGICPKPGRPEDLFRRLFDLPAQRVAFGSFEISFRAPDEQPDLFEESPVREALEEVSKLLRDGLTWLRTDAADEGLFTDKDSDKTAAILMALKEITPSTHSSIHQLELYGPLVGTRRPLVVDRTARQKVNAALKAGSLEPELVDLVGRIRELDKDRFSFELREIEGPLPEQKFVFDQELAEDVFNAFHDEILVRVAGKTFPVRNVAYAIAVTKPSHRSSGGAS